MVGADPGAQLGRGPRRVRSLTDVVEQTGLPISVVEEVLEELIRERRVKLERSLAAHWRPHPEAAQRFTDSATDFYRLDSATAP